MDGRGAGAWLMDPGGRGVVLGSPWMRRSGDGGLEGVGNGLFRRDLDGLHLLLSWGMDGTLTVESPENLLLGQ